MAITNPKYHIKNIIDNITTTKDNGVTAAQLLFIYEHGPEDLDYLFFNQDYDIVVTVGDPDPNTASGDRREIQDQPVHYTGIYPVTVFSMDKYSPVGNLVCTATKMQHKLTLALRTIIEANAQQTTYTIKITAGRPRNRRVGGLWLWSTEHKIEYFELNP